MSEQERYISELLEESNEFRITDDLMADWAVEKINAGAQLVQLYSGLVYRGPELVRECVQAIR